MGELLMTRETVATETPASRATSLIVAILYLLIGVSVYTLISVAEKSGVFKRRAVRHFTKVIQGCGNCVIVTQRSVTKAGEFESLVTLCLRLLRLSAGRERVAIATFEIPEVLIGDVNPRLTAKLYTSLRSYAGFFCLLFNM